MLSALHSCLVASSAIKMSLNMSVSPVSKLYQAVLTYLRAICRRVLPRDSVEAIDNFIPTVINNNCDCRENTEDYSDYISFVAQKFQAGHQTEFPVNIVSTLNGGNTYTNENPFEYIRYNLGKVDIPERHRKQLSKLLLFCKEQSVAKDVIDHSLIPDSDFKHDYLRLINGNITDKMQQFVRLQPDPELDRELAVDFMATKTNARYMQMQEERQRLPAYKMKQAVLDMIENNQIVIISGETGCGKTTQVTQFILDSYLEQGKGSMCHIVCSQPRRIAAITVAERVAAERAEYLGESVGYAVRFDTCMPRSRGSILYCTTGSILRYMETQICLDEVTHLVLDEIHERDVHSDFLIALLTRIIVYRPDLKVILMSATLNARSFANYFKVDSILEIPGFTHDVAEYYLEDVLVMTNYDFIPYNTVQSRKAGMSEAFEPVRVYWEERKGESNYPKEIIEYVGEVHSEDYDERLIGCLVNYICEKDETGGAILIFLTGFNEIQSLSQYLHQSFVGYRLFILHLHSQINIEDQKFVFEPAPSGKRKIILSTNIAETSVTIDDVVFVVDLGKVKVRNYNLMKNEYTLIPTWESLANARQRRGRAGRVRPGTCYHLFSRGRLETFKKFQEPEIQRQRLESVIISTKVHQLGNAEEFLSSLMDPPDIMMVKSAVSVLKGLDVVDNCERMTPLGYHIARLPISPQLGKMILLASMFSCVNPILCIAVTLDYRDPFMLSGDNGDRLAKERLCEGDGEKSDHIVMYRALYYFEYATDRSEFCYEYYLNFCIMNQLLDMKQQFMQYLYDAKFLHDLDSHNPEFNKNSNDLNLVKAIVCAGLYPNIAINRSERSRRLNLYSADFNEVKLHSKSVLRTCQRLDSPILVYYEKVRSTSDFIQDASMTNGMPVILFGDCFESKRYRGEQMITIGSWLKFNCDIAVVQLIRKARNFLSRFFEEKLSHPGFVNWDDPKQKNDILILGAIRDLLTMEAREELKFLQFEWEDPRVYEHTCSRYW